MNEAERRKYIDEYGRGHSLLKAALDRIPREAWGFKPAPTEWSVRQLIFHMADSEMLGVTRLYMIVAQPGSSLMPYDDAIWGEALSYPERDADEALELFGSLRQSTLHLLAALPEGLFLSSVKHPEIVYPEYGEAFNVEKWLRIYTRHVNDHIDQLADIHRAWTEHKE
jgi:hypothetical protein